MTEPTQAGSTEDPPGSAAIVLGGGCFWCIEAVFERLKGVHSVVSGYSGGPMQNPSYEDICSGGTGHAEVVRVVFDPATLSLDTLFDVFFTLHDPTTRNRQGNDVGTQYRSIIFVNNAAEREAALAAKLRIDATGVWAARAVTEIIDAEKFWPAEAHHQHYFNGHATQPYCAAVIAPKVAKLRKKFGPLLRTDG